MLSKCYLCYGRNTNHTITLAGNVSGPSLPVCTICVPPWINNEKHDWSYELRYDTKWHQQRKPTQDEITELKKDKDNIKKKFLFDQGMYEREKDNHYEQKFRIDALLQCWDEKNQRYNFE